jgi:hypothetical protein
LKAEMAACWKLVWNVDPLPFSVPERLLLPELLVLPLLGVLLVLELLLELQALTMSMPRTAVVTAAQRALLALIVLTVSLFSLTTRGLPFSDRALPLSDRTRPDGMALMVWGGFMIRRLPVCRFLRSQQPDLRTVPIVIQRICYLR